jgi:hypothetical protein
VFLNLLDAAEGALIRAAASTQPFGGSWPNNIDGLVAAEIDVESLEGKRLRLAQVAWFSSRRLMNGACRVSAIAPRVFECISAWLCDGHCGRILNGYAA